MLKQTFRKFLEEPLPDGIGWPHVFGSMLLALFALQFITGILLSFVYAPSPLSAHQSVSYLLYGLNSGAWLRGLHYWGASFIVILLALHLIRTFVYAAYKRPRQATWILGALLFFCALAFAQTGYLLPWDQKAYWGTTVTIRIAETIPFLGPKIAYLLRGGERVGALTLSRFYSIHVVLLPLFTVFLILGHLYLIRRHGITKPWTNVDEAVEKRIPFYPFQMAKDATAMLLILVLLFFFASVLPTPLGRPADPTDATFNPRPDWYFLFLFQSLHYFKGPWEVVGTVVLPGIASAVLVLLPFLDRNPSRSPKRRPVALLMLLLVIGGLCYLTYQAEADRPRSPGWQRPAGILLPRPERLKRPSEIAGIYQLQQNCFSCHSLTALGLRSDLETLSRNAFPSGGDWLQQHLQQHRNTATLSDHDKSALMSILKVVAEKNANLIYTVPKEVRFGGNFFFNKSCVECHKIDGEGGLTKKGPDLTLRLLRPKEWHKQHIKDAQSVNPVSKMPPFFHYEDSEFDALAEYILYLHTP
jgi:quinol-cytochrome oxidoreductase complex cytochrome b subunit